MNKPPATQTDKITPAELRSTFQELTEQFAEIVIPKVWEKEDRKVARVAKRLSVSPKKVRRILARAGKRKK